MRVLLTTGLALALAGCGSEEVANNSVAPRPTPTPPTLGGVDLNTPLRASGTGPYWQIDIAPGTIAYAASPDAHPTDFYPVSPTLGGGRAIFETQTPEAEPVTITLTAAACMAGKASLSLTAEAKIGARTLKGCAGPAPRPVREAVPVEGENMTVATENASAQP